MDAPTSLTDEQLLDSAIELDQTHRQQSAELMARQIKARIGLQRELYERNATWQAAASVKMLDQVIDAWRANYAELGFEPDTYGDQRAQDLGTPISQFRGSRRLASSAHPWLVIDDPNFDEGDELAPLVDLGRLIGLRLDCGPGKHFVLSCIEYDRVDGAVRETDMHYGVWFASAGVDGERAVEQLVELREAAKAGLWTPERDDRPRTDDAGIRLLDHRGSVVLRDAAGRSRPNTVLEALTGSPDD